MYFAQIINNIVENVIIADNDFIQTLSDLYVEYDNGVTSQPDDTKVARIGEAYIDGKFINANQAVELGYMTKDEALVYGFHSGYEYNLTLQEQLDELKAKILAIKPDVIFPNDVDADGNNLASLDELQAYYDLLLKKQLEDKFGTI